MASEFLAVFWRVNLALITVLAGLLLLRGPVRRHCGSDAVYGLWIAAPIAVLVLCAPGGLMPRMPWLIPAKLPLHLIEIWLAGAALSVAQLMVAQARLMARARRGEVGPAVLGLLSPRVYLPTDFEARFAPAEQAVIRAHERAHMLRGDPTANSFAAALQTVFWFNPATHLAIRFFREDQEMACDQTVMAEYPERRRLYAETMLKSQGVHWSPTLGCAWGRHPLEDRVKALTLTPSVTRLVTIRLLIAGAAFLLMYQAENLYFPQASTGFAFARKPDLVNLPKLHYAVQPPPSAL